MSSKAGKVKRQIAEQRMATVVQVLSIMQNEAEQMSWFQRWKVGHSFLWKKNIDCFFQLASKNCKKEKKNAEVQDN